MCQKNVHICAECSKEIGNEEGYGQKRICHDCSKYETSVAATRYEENWKGLNSEIEYLDIEFLLMKNCQKFQS